MMTDTLMSNGERSVRRHLLLTSVRTTPQALLRLVRQRWSIENAWHWSRDTRLGEDAQRYANRIGAPVFAFLQTDVMNLLRRGGDRSIRQGVRELACDIQGMLALGGVATRTRSTGAYFQAALPRGAIHSAVAQTGVAGAAVAEGAGR